MAKAKDVWSTRRAAQRRKRHACESEDDRSGHHRRHEAPDDGKEERSANEDDRLQSRSRRANYVLYHQRRRKRGSYSRERDSLIEKEDQARSNYRVIPVLKRTTTRETPSRRLFDDVDYKFRKRHQRGQEEFEATQEHASIKKTLQKAADRKENTRRVHAYDKKTSKKGSTDTDAPPKERRAMYHYHDKKSRKSSSNERDKENSRDDGFVDQEKTMRMTRPGKKREGGERKDGISNYKPIFRLKSATEPSPLQQNKRGAIDCTGVDASCARVLRMLGVPAKKILPHHRVTPTTSADYHRYDDSDDDGGGGNKEKLTRRWQPVFKPEKKTTKINTSRKRGSAVVNTRREKEISKTSEPVEDNNADDDKSATRSRSRRAIYRPRVLSAKGKDRKEKRDKMASSGRSRQRYREEKVAGGGDDDDDDGCIRHNQSKKQGVKNVIPVLPISKTQKRRNVSTAMERDERAKKFQQHRRIIDKKEGEYMLKKFDVTEERERRVRFRETVREIPRKRSLSDRDTATSTATAAAVVDGATGYPCPSLPALSIETLLRPETFDSRRARSRGLTKEKEEERERKAGHIENQARILIAPADETVPFTMEEQGSQQHERTSMVAAPEPPVPIDSEDRSEQYEHIGRYDVNANGPQQYGAAFFAVTDSVPLSPAYFWEGVIVEHRFQFYRVTEVVVESQRALVWSHVGSRRPRDRSEPPAGYMSRYITRLSNIRDTGGRLINLTIWIPM